MFEGLYPAVVEALLDRQLSDAYANEITEAEWVQDLLDAERRRQITSLSDAEAIAELIEVETVLPEVLAVSEWLPHELQMAHPYSWTAVQDLVQTSLVLTGRLSATLDLLRAGRIDYVRARIMADLLGTCAEPVAHTVEAMVLPKAPGLTPGGRAADVGYYPTSDGMARFYAYLPLPAAGACTDAIRAYAKTQRQEGTTARSGRSAARSSPI